MELHLFSVVLLGFKDGNMAQSGNESTIDNGSNRSDELRNASGGEMCYSQYINGVEGPSSSSGQKDIAALENGCGFRGSKDGSCLSESGESLRVILSDPLTYVLSDKLYFVLSLTDSICLTIDVYVVVLS